jgi:uncharacterized repeat protein (TIGR03803 family)
LIQGSDGNFYGTTQAGGASGHGAVFSITPAGVETALYSFSSGADGATPTGGLIQGSDGNFYGTTFQGGASSAGTIFKVTSTGNETVFWSFGSGADGTGPQAALIQGSDGNFYGTTQAGGASGYGTVFRVTPAGVETVLYSFGGGTDGRYPYAGMTQGADGNFYGTTHQGGANSIGTIFKLTPAGVETVLWSFGGGTDGQNPYGTLIQGADGNFYGTTFQGSTNNEGTIFKITPAGVETVVYSFGGVTGTDGRFPEAGLIQGADGNFYGTTEAGNTSGYGTVFKF